MSKNELGKLIEKGVDATLWHTSVRLEEPA